MALKLYDKLTPSGDFPLVGAEHVELPGGGRLDTMMTAVAGMVDENGKIKGDYLPEAWVQTYVEQYVNEALGGEY